MTRPTLSRSRPATLIQWALLLAIGGCGTFGVTLDCSQAPPDWPDMEIVEVDRDDCHPLHSACTRVNFCFRKAYVHYRVRDAYTVAHETGHARKGCDHPMDSHFRDLWAEFKEVVCKYYPPGFKDGCEGCPVRNDP